MRPETALQDAMIGFLEDVVKNQTVEGKYEGDPEHLILLNQFQLERFLGREQKQ